MDDQFKEPLLTDERLEQLRSEAPDRFGQPNRAELIEVGGGVGPAGSNLHSRSRFVGWDFAIERPRWLLRTYRDRLTLHLARPGQLPEGAYLGWETVRAHYGDVHDFMEPFYAERQGRRTAVRYLNRIVLPTGSALEDWFTISPQAPDTVVGAPYSFQVAQTWEKVQGHPGFSATVRLSKLQIGEEALPPDTYPVLLDVEVFNLWVRDAPDYDELPDWYDEAHAIENDVFESCITDSLRGRFS